MSRNGTSPCENKVIEKGPNHFNNFLCPETMLLNIVDLILMHYIYRYQFTKNLKSFFINVKIDYIEQASPQTKNVYKILSVDRILSYPQQELTFYYHLPLLKVKFFSLFSSKNQHTRNKSFYGFEPTNQEKGALYVGHLII